MGFVWGLCSLVVQLPRQEIRRKTPGRFSQDRIVAFAVGHGESVADAMEEVPIQWLAVGLQTRHQLLLHRNTGYVIMRAEKYLR